MLIATYNKCYEYLACLKIEYFIPKVHQLKWLDINIYYDILYSLISPVCL